MLVQQMQRMAEQMERENQKLLGTLGGTGMGSMSGDGAYSAAGPTRQGRGLGIDPFTEKRGSEADQDTAKRPRRVDPATAKIEQKYQDDIRLMQLEFERLKQQRELEEYKYQMEKLKAQRVAEDEHNEWLQKQKQDLQALKVKQAIAKEQRLLQVHAGPDAMEQLSPDRWNTESPQASPLKQQPGGGPARNNALLEESGCGSTKLPVDLSRGISVVSDGLLIAPETHQDELFRIAMGIYDAKGKIVAKLSASEWQPWTDTPGDRAAFNFLAQPGSLKRIIKAAKDGDPPTLVLGLRALIEVQTRTPTGPQRACGWAVMPLITEEPSGARFLQSGLWRLSMRKGVSDPSSDPLILPKREDCLLNSWILLRLSDLSMVEVQSAFVPQNYAGFVNEDSVLDGYQEPGASYSMLDMGSDDGSSVGRQTPRRMSSRPPSALDGIRSASRLGSRDRPGTGLGAISEDVKDDDDGFGLVSKARTEEKVPWLLGTPTGPATEKYRRGDGIDIYIDSAQFLPDNCTVTRLVLKVFAMDKEPLFNPPGGIVGEVVSPPLTFAKSPVYRSKTELRQSIFNTTATALIRIDTLDCSSLLPVSVGYACFKLFCSRDRVQPKAANATDCFLNTGAFQLPIYAGRPGGLESYDEKMLQTCNGGKGLSRIPCASLLVRVVTAPRSPDGLAVLSRDDYPREEWGKLGLDIPPPIYASGAYHGVLCQPTDEEKVCFTAKAEVPVLVEASVSQAMTGRLGSLPQGITAKPVGAHESELLSWLASFFPTDMKRTIDLSFTVPYSLDRGLQVSVDMLHGMPEQQTGLFTQAPSLVYKVIYSIVPPGLFYKDPPLSEGVRFTKTENWDRPAKAPLYLDGFNDFSPSQLDESVYLVLDVRTVRIEPPKNNRDLDIIVESAVLEKCYWTMLPLSKERTPGQGFRYVASGTFQVPLVKGPVPEDIFATESPLQEFLSRLGSKTKSTTALKLSDGASVIVRVVNPLLRTLFEDTDPRTDFVNRPQESPNNLQTAYFTRILSTAAAGSTGKAGAAPEKFAFDAVKSTIGRTTAMQLPKQVDDPKKLSRDISKKFAAVSAIDMQQ